MLSTKPFLKRVERCVNTRQDFLPPIAKGRQGFAHFRRPLSCDAGDPDIQVSCRGSSGGRRIPGAQRLFALPGHSDLRKCQGSGGSRMFFLSREVFLVAEKEVGLALQSFLALLPFGMTTDHLAFALCPPAGSPGSDRPRCEHAAASTAPPSASWGSCPCSPPRPHRHRSGVRAGG